VGLGKADVTFIAPSVGLSYLTLWRTSLPLGSDLVECAELRFDNPMDVSSTRPKHATLIDELSTGQVCCYPENLSGGAFRDFPSVSCYAHVERAFSGKGNSAFCEGFTRNLSSQEQSLLRPKPGLGSYSDALALYVDGIAGSLLDKLRASALRRLKYPFMAHLKNADGDSIGGTEG